MKASEFKKIIREEVRKEINQQHLNEDMALVGDIALGVAGGLVGLWALVKGVPLVIGTLGAAAGELANKVEAKAKEAAAKAKREGRLETIKPIVAKFQSDMKLADMYKALPAYNSGISAKAQQSNKLRTKQLQDIAKYIKAKLTPEEMTYFQDVSAMLRTGDIKERALGEATASSSDLKKIEDFVLSHPAFESASPSRLKSITKEIFDEWKAVATNYKDLQAYFDEMDEYGGLEAFM